MSDIEKNSDLGLSDAFVKEIQEVATNAAYRSMNSKLALIQESNFMADSCAPEIVKMWVPKRTKWIDQYFKTVRAQKWYYMYLNWLHQPINLKALDLFYFYNDNTIPFLQNRISDPVSLIYNKYLAVLKLLHLKVVDYLDYDFLVYKIKDPVQITSYKECTYNLYLMLRNLHQYCKLMLKTYQKQNPQILTFIKQTSPLSTTYPIHLSKIHQILNNPQIKFNDELITYFINLVKQYIIFAYFINEISTIYPLDESMVLQTIKEMEQKDKAYCQDLFNIFTTHSVLYPGFYCKEHFVYEELIKNLKELEDSVLNHKNLLKDPTILYPNALDLLKPEDVNKVKAYQAKQKEKEQEKAKEEATKNVKDIKNDVTPNTINDLNAVLTEDKKDVSSASINPTQQRILN